MLEEPVLIRRMRRFYHRVRFEWLQGNPRYADSLAAARIARSRMDWRAAEIHYRLASAVRPDGIGARLNHVMALKELGRLEEAEVVCREVVRRAPRSAESHLALGHMLSLLGRADEASAVYSMATALQLAQESGLVEDAWSGFLAKFPTPRPAPDAASAERVAILLDGRTSAPSVLRRTLASVEGQTHENWVMDVLVTAAIKDHPVASITYRDPRFRLVETTEIGSDNPARVDGVLMLAPGVILDPMALDWLMSAAARLEADGINVEGLYADHDHQHPDVRHVPQRFMPVLFPAPGVHDLSTTPEPPALLYLPDDDRRICLEFMAAADDPGPPMIRTMALALLAGKRALRHVPLVLCSLLAQPDSAVPEAPKPSGHPSLPVDQPVRISVVVPTRDQAEMLETCVRSLKRLAIRPDLIDIVVMNNRSIEPKTEDILDGLKSEFGLRVMVVDEPFNWSRLNNLGAAGLTDGIVVFANNDVEMLSTGWDEVLRSLLAEPEVGAVGARLLYPDGTLQHVGVVLGAVGGRPVHEGSGSRGSDAGPLHRWRRTRETAAVTGAFLAARVDTLGAIGGFEESLAVAYNDIDFCLRVRAVGLSVIYAADIEAIHFESKTRGLALTAEKIAWDDGEFGELQRIWGEACATDPFVHPAWSFALGRSFEALVPLTTEAIEAAIREPRAPVRVSGRPATPASVRAKKTASKPAKARGRKTI